MTLPRVQFKAPKRKPRLVVPKSRSNKRALVLREPGPSQRSMSNINGVEARDRSASRVCKAIITEKKKHFRTTVQELYKKRQRFSSFGNWATQTSRPRSPIFIPSFGR